MRRVPEDAKGTLFMQVDARGCGQVELCMYEATRIIARCSLPPSPSNAICGGRV